ncbi:hypothetical protein KL941_003281 [Ogataea angusta]|nr:hypothetical protein KL941_003281 [Ogataea angusta]
MGKGAARFGGKSGFLPKPRDIFKQPYKHVVYQKEPDTGYADGILHPLGTTRDLIRPPVVTPEERLLRTARPPKQAPDESALQKMAAEQRANIKQAELRRKYLAESYQTEVGRLERLEAQERRRAEEQAKVEQAAREYKASHAEVYTMPTTEAGGEPAGAGAGAEAGAGGQAAGTVQCGGEFRRDGGKTQGDGGQCVLGQKAAGGEGHAERGSERSGLATKLGRVRQDGCGRDSGHREQGSVAGRCGGHAERLQRDDAGGGADEDGGEEDGAEAEGGGEAETAAAAAGGDSSRAGAEARGG